MQTLREVFLRKEIAPLMFNRCRVPPSCKIQNPYSLTRMEAATASSMAAWQMRATQASQLNLGRPFTQQASNLMRPQSALQMRAGMATRTGLRARRSRRVTTLTLVRWTSGCMTTSNKSTNRRGTPWGRWTMSSSPWRCETARAT